jgi:tRNA A37 methylthiotransferase MiaB
VGSEAVVLLEGLSPRQSGDGKQSWQGRDLRGAVVHVPMQGNAGKTVRVRITAANPHSLLAEELS